MQTNQSGAKPLLIFGWDTPGGNASALIIPRLGTRQLASDTLSLRALQNCANLPALSCLLFPQFSSVQSLSPVQVFVTPWTAACQASLSITNSRSLPKLMAIELVMPSNHLILCGPLLLPSVFPSIRVFSNESALHIRWPKYWSFSFNISPSNEHPGLISFRMDWLDLLAIQGTLKSLLQHHSSEASPLRLSAFYMVQLSHPHVTPGNTTEAPVRAALPPPCCAPTS